MSVRSISLLAAALLAVASLLAVRPTASDASTRIVTREGSRKVVALSPPRGRSQALFRVPEGLISSVAASRNGRRIAVASHAAEGSHGHHVWREKIWMLNGDGHHARLVRSFVYRRYRQLRQIESISLSPDGRRLLVATDGRSNGHFAVFLLRADGSGLRQIRVPGYGFGTGGSGFNSSRPQFTPDGWRIISIFFSRGPREERMRGIGIVPLRGGRIHFLRSGPLDSAAASGLAPTISGDGRLVTFVVWHKRASRIMIMRRDGTHLHPLTGLARWLISNPCFSPSGDALTFAADHRSKEGFLVGEDPSFIFTIRRDGTRRRVISRDLVRWYYRNPVWTR